MSKYIIKNCPTLMGNRLCYGKEIRQCQDCTDCVMKQIVEACGKYQINMLLVEILDLLDIQEVE